MHVWWQWLILSIGVALVFGLVFLYPAVWGKSYDRRAIGYGVLRELIDLLSRRDREREDDGLSAEFSSDLRQWLLEISLERSLKDAIKEGLLMFSSPTAMVQGTPEQVEVKIARSAAFRDTLIKELHSEGEPRFEEIPTSLYMEAMLSGAAFEIITHDPPEQIIIPTPAAWHFDVLPYRSGTQYLTLDVSSE
jgi:hypothetical protein